MCSSDLIDRAALRIQNTIEESTTTAISPQSLRKIPAPFVEIAALANCSAGADEKRKRDGKQNSNPDSGHPGISSGLLEIARDNANDQSRLDALAKHYQEWNKHKSKSPAPSWHPYMDLCGIARSHRLPRKTKQ